MNNTSFPILPIYQHIYLWYSFNIIPAILGFLGNLWFCLIISQTRTLWNKSSYRIVMSVVIPDMIINGINIPFESTQTFLYMTEYRYIGNQIICAIEGSIFLVALSLSNLGQMFVAVLRCSAVCTPILFRKLVTPRSVTLIILVFNILPTLSFYYGGIFTIMTYDIDDVIGDCTELVLFRYVDDLRNALFQFIPIGVGLSCYIIILTKILIAPAGGARSIVVKRARGSMAMCATMGMFSTCVIVYWVGNKTRNSIENNLWQKVALRLTYGWNPIFYITLDKNLRSASIRWIRRLFNKETNINAISRTSNG